MELKPFYPIQTYKSGSYREMLHKKMMEKLEKEGCEKAVLCPEGESIDQWVAIHMVFFFNDVNLYYGSVQEKCTNYSCPTMTAGVKFEYLLMDKLKNKSPSRVPAKTYVDNMFNWAVHLLEDEHIFPPEKDSTFPPNYVDKVKSIAKRYFRVYAHVYYSHLETLQEHHIDKMFYDSFTYYLIFIDMYSLVPSSDLRPLSSLIIRLVPHLRISQQLKEMEEEMNLNKEEKSESGLESSLQSLPKEIKNDDAEKVDWNQILNNTPECDLPESQRGVTEGDENCECIVL